MSTINIDTLGTGVLQVPPDPLNSGRPAAVCLNDERGHRLTLRAVPAGQPGVLVAILDGPSDVHNRSLLHAWAPGGVALALGKGRIWANQPAPGVGPADLVGITPANNGGLDTSVLKALAGKTVLLEVHKAGCGCRPVAAIPAQRRAVRKEATR
jgi:hypothetical protein